MSNHPRPTLSLAEAEALVRQRLGRRVRDLCLSLREGRVVLQGRAVNYHAKQLAQHLAYEALGRPPLSNEIEVCPPALPPAEDEG
jgi:hypothetical protein